jgi:hypothetical protein
MNQHLGRVGTATFLFLALLGTSGLRSAVTGAPLFLASARAAGPSAHGEPAHAEPAHAEPAHAEPAHAEPAHAEPPSKSAPGAGSRIGECRPRDATRLLLDFFALSDAPTDSPDQALAAAQGRGDSKLQFLLATVRAAPGL